MSFKNGKSIRTILLIVLVAVAGVATAGALYYSSLSTNPYAESCSANKNINVNVTSFEVNFIYTGSSSGYLKLLSQTPDKHSESSSQNCPLYFLDGVIVEGVNGSLHTFSNLSLSPNSFEFANNGGFSGPQSAAEIFPAFTIAYVGHASYTGPLVIDIYSSS
jgi:hypothetical protein